MFILHLMSQAQAVRNNDGNCYYRGKSTAIVDCPATGNMYRKVRVSKQQSRVTNILWNMVDASLYNVSTAPLCIHFVDNVKSEANALIKKTNWD